MRVADWSNFSQYVKQHYLFLDNLKSWVVLFKCFLFLCLHIYLEPGIWELQELNGVYSNGTPLPSYVEYMSLIIGEVSTVRM